MGILGGACCWLVGRSVGRSRFYFSGGAGPAAGGEGAGPAAAAGTESPGPRPGGSAEHQAPAAEVRRSVGPMAGGLDGTGGFTGPDISPMGYDPPGPQRTGTAGGRILPARLNQSATSAHPERFIPIAPMSSAGPVGLRSERERERDLKVARPGRSAGRIVGPFSCRGRRPDGPLRGPFRRSPARPPRPLLCCLLPASGLRWAGRSYPPPDRPFPLGRRILPFKMRKLSFSHHFCIIPTPYFPNNIGRR